MKPLHQSCKSLPTLAAAALCALLTPWAAMAQPAAAPSTAKVGLGLSLSDDGYKGLGVRTTLLPAVQIQSPRFSLRGTSAEYIVTDPSRSDFSVNLRADALLQGYKSSDAPIFAGMANRKPSLLLGVGAKFLTPVGQLWLEAGNDVTGNSKGLRTEVGLGWKIDTSTVLGQWSLSPYVSAQNNSAKLANYYYGVTASEAIAGRPSYEAGSTTNFNLGVSAATDLTPSLSLVIGARYRAFGSGIRQSPLVDSAGGLSGSASLLYRLY
jgi:MipA family protein